MVRRSAPLTEWKPGIEPGVSLPPTSYASCTLCPLGPIRYRLPTASRSSFSSNLSAASASAPSNHCTGVQSPAKTLSVGQRCTLPHASARPSAIASAAATASSIDSGILRNDTNSVGSRSPSGGRRQMSRHSWMPVFSEKAILRGSWEVTIRSMWKRSARNRRSARPDAPVQPVTGSTFARTPRSARSSRSASGVKNVRMLLVVMTRWPPRHVPSPGHVFPARVLAFA